MTLFEFIFSGLFAAAGALGAIVLPEDWQRAICVVVTIGMTMFAGLHGFKLV